MIDPEAAERWRPVLEAAMDAAREALRGMTGAEITKGALFFEIADEGGEPMRLAASYPRGNFLGASDLAAEGAQAFSVQAALHALRHLPEDPE